MKESNTTEIAEFAKARNIDDELALDCWTPYVLRKRDVIISSVKLRARKTTHKYVIELPTSVEHACAIEQRIDNSV